MGANISIRLLVASFKKMREYQGKWGQRRLFFTQNNLIQYFNFFYTHLVKKMCKKSLIII